MTCQYTLYFSENGKVWFRCHGIDVKQLKDEFFALGHKYNFAYITKLNDSKILHKFDAEGRQFSNKLRKKRKSNPDLYSHPIGKDSSGKMHFRTKMRIAAKKKSR